jgi:Zn-dependent peptidase ImmA (M78 family)/transcriptional regulator with XRE-family HTH domain
VDKTVNPQMLILARESRGLAQKDLAEAVSVTQGKISKYENGMLLVSEEDLARIAEHLGYTREFFYQEDKVYGLGSSFLFHRQRKTTPMLIQKKVQANINILRMQVDRLLRGAEIDAENRFEPLDIDSYNGDVEKVARIIRAAWKLPLGPVANVTASIESAGGIVLKCSFETSMIDAAHLWLQGLPPLFFVNKDLPGDRLRWTLAHEIGHAIMHRNPMGNPEEEANRFANEFLMPEDEIAHQLKDITIERAAALKPLWKVSMAAIIRRASTIGGITERKYRSLFTSLSAQGYKTIEPFPIDTEEPQTVRQLVELHRSELGYDDFDLAQLLFSTDPQFFWPNQLPTILKLGGQSFFGFSRVSGQNRRQTM